MEFFQRLFGSGTQSSSSVQDLTKKEVDDAENDFLKEYKPNPSNQEIADKLGRHVNEVNVIRIPPPHSGLHDRYDSSELSKTPLRDLSELNKNGGKSKKSLNKNKKKYKKLSRRHRHHSKKNRKSMKRK